MSGCQHFLYSRQANLDTWVAPATAIPVETADLGAAREVLDLRTTGACRALYQRALGAKAVDGALNTYWWQAGIIGLLASFMRDTATTGVGDPYTHAFLYDDSQGFLPLSAQMVFKDSASSMAENILGAVVNTFAVNLATKDKTVLNFGLLAKDEAPAGSTWDFDGSVSPAKVAAPGALYAATARPFTFYDATLTLGGTPSIAGKIISIAGGTAYAKATNVSIANAHGLDPDGFGLAADPTRQEIWPGNREITVSVDLSWTDYSTVLYEAARAGTPMALQLDQVISANREAHVVVPSVFFDPGKLPALTGGSEKKTITLTGKAQVDSVTGKDFNVWVKTAEATV